MARGPEHDPPGQVRPESGPGAAAVPLPDLPDADAAWVRQHLPPRAAVAAGPVSDHVAALAEAEVPAVRGAVERRRHEFSTGRHLARRAARALGVELAAVPMRADRRPDWPPGLIGSIAHAGGLCVAVLAEAAAVAAVGVDLERIADVGPELSARIAPDSDWRQNRAALPADALRACLFSAREAVFKAYHPATGGWPDFHDLAVRIDAPGGRFTARLTAPGLPPFFGAAEIPGQFAILGPFVATLVLHRPRSG